MLIRWLSAGCLTYCRRHRQVTFLLWVIVASESFISEVGRSCWPPINGGSWRDHNTVSFRPTPASSLNQLINGLELSFASGLLFPFFAVFLLLIIRSTSLLYQSYLFLFLTLPPLAFRFARAQFAAYFIC